MMTFSLPKPIEDNIFQYRFRDFLKKEGKPYGNNKSVLERLENACITDMFFKDKLERFIVDEISNGKNKQVFLCNFSVESLKILGSLKTVQSNLAAKNLPFNNFNKLLDDSNVEGEMVYLNIEVNNQNDDEVQVISMSFLRETIVEYLDDNDEPKEKLINDFIWIDIFPPKGYLQIKIRPHSRQYIPNFERSKKVFNQYRDFLKDLFGIKFTDMSESKNTLFNIFKILTEKAEAPYIKKVESSKELIEESILKICDVLGIPNQKEPVDIPNRVMRLFERALIINDIHNYKSYDKDKLGIVDRIDFSDESGAKVNTLSGDDGIEVADVFFDTRETLDELKHLNKLWVRWFLSNPVSDDESAEVINQVETRFEVFENRLIINFLNLQSVPKEVQEYVLSLFRKFEEGEISSSINRTI